MKIHSFFLFTLILCFSLKFDSSQAQNFSTIFKKRYDDYKKAAPKERIQIITDRDLYAPGDMIWLNAFVFDIFSPKISLNSDRIKLSLFNKESMEIINKEYSLNNGAIDGFIKLPERLQDGVYYLRGKTKNSGDLNYFYKKIFIQKKIVPQFVIKVNFPDKKYIPGDEIPISIDFQNFYNEPLKTVNYQIDFFDGNKKIFDSAGKIKKTGNVLLNVKVPLRSNSGLFSYEISADSKGSKKAQLKNKFPVISDKLFIDFYPDYGKIINGLETDINFYAYDASGEPLAIEADLFENNKKISALHSKSNGMGSFKLLPKINHTYHVQIERPVMLEKKYQLPVVEAKGIALEEIAKTSSELKYKLINGYNNPRLVYLIGVSNGEIFWTSEHEIEKELTVDVDISKAKGRILHFIVSNAASRIEGEQIVVKSGNESAKLNVDINTEKAVKFSRIDVDINSKALGEGRLFLSVVNTPWLVGELHSHRLLSVDLPLDLEQQIIFKSQAFQSSDFANQTLEDFAKYYVPFGFGWDRVLNTDGAFTHNEPNLLVLKNKKLNDQMIAGCKIEKRERKIVHSNSNADNYFITSNPKYISKLHFVKKERIPSYISMLESGSSIKDVIQTIKPYNLQGSNIVFLGSANSINFQGGALIVVDGTNRGTDASVLDNLSPYDVEKIFVSTKPTDIQRYTALNSVGLIEITLISGNVEELESQEDVDENAQFEVPEYVNGKGNSDDDYRTTLYWAPKIKVGRDGLSKVVFYNSNLISNVMGRIYFIPTKGRPSVYEFEYTIK